MELNDKLKDLQELLRSTVENGENTTALKIMDVLFGKKPETNEPVVVTPIFTQSKTYNKRHKKLNFQIAQQIRNEYPNRTISVVEMAKQYGVAPGAIYKIVRGEAYKEA